MPLVPNPTDSDATANATSGPITGYGDWLVCDECHKQLEVCVNELGLCPECTERLVRDAKAWRTVRSKLQSLCFTYTELTRLPEP